MKDKKRIIRWLLSVAFLEEQEIESIQYVFCEDDYLLLLNKKFLKHQTLTDVLTFDYSVSNRIETEIYISVDRVKANAKYYQVGFDAELHRVMIHGLLHCMGYDDSTKTSQIKIHRREDEYLEMLDKM